MKHAHQGVSQLLHVTIERDGKQKFRIETDQLERIGEQLRGRRHFSVFNSIVLPVIVTILTTLLTGLFQFVSWTNSVRLQNATDQALKASETIERAAAAIGKRRYASLLFIPTVRDLAVAMPESKLASSDPANANMLLTTGSIREKGETETSLHALTRQLLKSRYEAYYLHLRGWNEAYDQLLTDIDYNLDRPILLQAQIKSEAISVFQNKFKSIDCSESLTGQLAHLNLNKNSLKLQFAAIHYCFSKLNAELGQIVQNAPRVEPSSLDRAERDLGYVHTMANEFRCYGLRRVDYYHRQKELSILSPQLVVRRLMDSPKTEAMNHFDFATDRCRPERRPT